jgi:hypothetical protein
MNIERKQEIEKEAKRRLGLWLKHSSFDEMTIRGSYMRFSMSLGMIGYPFAKEKWMEDGDFERFITDDEFDSDEVNQIMSEMYFINNNNSISKFISSYKK